LEKFPLAAEKNIVSEAVEWSSLSVKSIRFMVLFNSDVSLLISCLDDPSIDERRVWY
jgi:hypothetical protein